MKSILLLFLFVSINCLSQTITWSSAMNIAPSSEGNLRPRIAIDASGNPMVIWGKSSSMECKFSKWNGSMFTAPVNVNPSSMMLFTAAWAGPEIASKGDTVYIVIKASPEDLNPFYIVRSFDGGQTFLPPVQVDFIAPDVSRFPTITIDDNGNPIIGYMKFDSTFANARWVVTKSYDYGNTFSADVPASGWSGGTVCDCCPGTIINEGNVTAMLYRDNNNDNRDTWVGMSIDTGNTFTTGWNIDQNNWNLASCPSTGPDGVIIGDTLFSVFMNGANGPKSYFSKSLLSTGMVSSVVPLSTMNSQNFPRMAKDGLALGIAWRQTVTGTDMALLKFTNSIDSGLPAFSDTIAMSNVMNVDIAIHNGKVFVVWQDYGAGTARFRSGTFTPLTTGIAENNYSREFILYPNPATSDNLRFYLNGLADGNHSCKITDAFGKCVLSSSVTISNGYGEIYSPLIPGMYFIQFDSDVSNAVRRFIKQ
jgi:hypothetical protein